MEDEKKLKDTDDENKLRDTDVEDEQNLKTKTMMRINWEIDVERTVENEGLLMTVTLEAKTVAMVALEAREMRKTGHASS